jgi:uncharacterized protein YutE (UPF0331/DUF86 family)
MIDFELVNAKRATIERCLARIAEVHGDGQPHLLAVDVADITAINLQRAIKAVIDLAVHVVAAESFGTPQSSAEAMTLLEHRGVIDPDLASRLRRMVSFRNRSIYEHQSVDPAVVKRIIERHLGDLRDLGARILEAFGFREGDYQDLSA